MRELGTPLLIHQPSYSLLNRWIEPDLLDTVGELGVGCITFSPLAQGVLTDRYLHGIPEGSRASRNDSLSPDTLTDETLAKVQGLNEIAARPWPVSRPDGARLDVARPTGHVDAPRASSVDQLEQNLASLDKLEFSADELAEVDRFAPELSVNLWAGSSAH